MSSDVQVARHRLEQLVHYFVGAGQLLASAPGLAVDPPTVI
jgi:hypothetical protein